MGRCDSRAGNRDIERHRQSKFPAPSSSPAKPLKKKPKPRTRNEERLDTFDNSDPVSMILKQSGMISVVRRNSIVGGESDFTSAPMTPREVRRRYSNGRDLEVVFRKG